jgi:hypothetical protein
MNMFRSLPMVLLSLSLLACGCQKASEGSDPAVATPAAVISASPVPQPELTPGKIKAGVGIEGVSLGQTKEQVTKTLGTPDEVDSNEYAPGQAYALYYSKGIELIYSNDKLEVIILHAPPEKNWTAAYTGATEQGFGVGSPAADIIKALGEPEPGTPRALRYPKLGIWFRLDADRTASDKTPRAESVQVMKPE